MLLAMERSYSPTNGNSAKVYLVDLSGAPVGAAAAVPLHFRCAVPL